MKSLVCAYTGTFRQEIPLLLFVIQKILLIQA